MFDDETRIVDVDDWHPPTVSRRKTTEVIMHVLVGGLWHRRSPELGETACGQSYHSEYSPVRPEQLRHPMSRACDCFTRKELAKADERYAEENP